MDIIIKTFIIAVAVGGWLLAMYLFWQWRKIEIIDEKNTIEWQEREQRYREETITDLTNFICDLYNYDPTTSISVTEIEPNVEEFVLAPERAFNIKMRLNWTKRRLTISTLYLPVMGKPRQYNKRISLKSNYLYHLQKFLLKKRVKALHERELNFNQISDVIAHYAAEYGQTDVADLVREIMRDTSVLIQFNKDLNDTPRLWQMFETYLKLSAVLVQRASEKEQKDVLEKGIEAAVPSDAEDNEVS